MKRRFLLDFTGPTAIFPPDIEDPIRSELFSADRLEQYAEQLRKMRDDQIEALLRGLYAAGFGDLTPAPPPDPERTKALRRVRLLKRLADSTTFPAERLNALEAMKRLIVKHAITEREI